ncbi:hypothetical protein DAKH74_004020 [Maudiozyma humilis]|uniref:Uncharacterized protein n=1 Tax=Maudiozyma humilis TaxID=51915 RepID=A0AAV5RSZ8_MAUHU|nr:hypothetical protein DAKH74_004020 [Kazachstania humilis]
MKLSQHNARNLETLLKAFRTSAPDLSIDTSTLLPMLYPSRSSLRETGRAQLPALASRLINIQVFDHNARVFQRSPQDINGCDFNYMHKCRGARATAPTIPLLTHNGARRASQQSLLTSFLEQQGIQRLANVPIPESRLPLRIRRKLDGIALLGVLGAIAARDPQASNVIVHDHILRLAPAKD